MDYAQYLQKVPSFEFEEILMIKLISYKRKIIFFFWRKPYVCVCVCVYLFVVEKKTNMGNGDYIGYFYSS
jgi:hypothetical protein